MKKTIGVGLVVLVIGASGFRLGRAEGELPMQELEVDHALTFDFPTPHTDWAQPYARGRIRVLFFSDGLGTAPRECVELIERFDIEGKAVFRAEIVDANRSHWHGGDVGQRRMIAVLHEKWDCFVFFGISLASLPPEAQYRLLKTVTDGAGLVLVGTDDGRVLKEKNRVKQLPPIFAREPVGDAFQIGKGRGVRVAQRPLIAYHEGWQVEDDYWQERLGRAVVWAAGREPSLRIEASVRKPQLAQNPVKGTLTLRLSGKPVGENLTLERRFRRPGDEPIQYEPRPVSPDATGAFLIPRVPAGQYHFDVRVLSSAGVESWTTVPFVVTSARTVAEISLAKDWGEIGDRIAGKVTLAGPALEDETLRVRLLDRRRRELVRSDVKPVAGHGSFDFAIEPWMPMLVTVEAQVLEGPREASRAWKYFHVTKRNRGQFNFLMWDFPVGTLAPYAEESLVRHGVTLQLQGSPSPPLYLAAFDVAYAPYTTRILASSKTPQGVMQPFCWNDEAAVAKHVTQLAQSFIPSRQHGVFVYSLGDENDTRGCCLSPHCARAYREYLKEAYGTLEALNRSWGTVMKSWEEVGLSAPNDIEETNSLAHDNYPRWFDRQAFKSYNYVKYCQKYLRAYARIDPQAKTGFEGAGGFAAGDDLDLIVRSLTFWSPYPSTADEVIRSIAPREMPRANWMGYTKDATSLLEQYWRMVTRGSDAVWWWRWDCIGLFHGWLAPDLRPYPAVKEILADTQIMRDGLGDLLLESQMQDDGIAMLYSYPSTFAHRVAQGPAYGDYESSHLRLHEALRDLGFQFRYVTDRMLRLGEFDPGRFRLLILARAEAIGDKEAEVIRRFAEQGGTVLADVRPGIYDDHCKPRAQGVLDDLFGIARTQRAPGSAAPKPARLATTEKAPVRIEIEKVQVDPSVRIVSPKAIPLAVAGGVPAVIVNPVGKGRAVLLNFPGVSYPKLSVPDTPESAAAFFEGLLAQAGLAPAVVVKDQAGRRVRDLETIRWRNGSGQIVALFRHAGKEQPATVELKNLGPHYVFDLRARQAVGQLAKAPVIIRPARPSLLALATRGTPTPRFSLDRSAADRGTIVKATLSVPDAGGLHAFRIRARAGDRRLEWLERNVVVGREPKTFAIPVAFNDPVGDYEIVAIDLFTDRPAKAVLTVR